MRCKTSRGVGRGGGASSLAACLAENIKINRGKGKSNDHEIANFSFEDFDAHSFKYNIYRLIYDLTKKCCYSFLQQYSKILSQMN